MTLAPLTEPPRKSESDLSVLVSQIPELGRLLLRLPALREGRPGPIDPEDPTDLGDILHELRAGARERSSAAMCGPEALTEALKGHGDVVDAQVLAPDPALRVDAVDPALHDDSRTSRLTAYLRPLDELAPPTDFELRTFLSHRLPGHAVPSAFVMVHALPGVPRRTVAQSIRSLLEQPIDLSDPTTVQEAGYRSILMERTVRALGARDLHIFSIVEGDLVVVDSVGASVPEETFPLLVDRLREAERSPPVGQAGFAELHLHLGDSRFLVVRRPPPHPAHALFVARFPAALAPTPSAGQVLRWLAESFERLETVSFPDDLRTLFHVRLARAVLGLCERSTRPTRPRRHLMIRLATFLEERSGRVRAEREIFLSDAYEPAVSRVVENPADEDEPAVEPGTRIQPDRPR